MSADTSEIFGFYKSRTMNAGVTEFWGVIMVLQRKLNKEWIFSRNLE